METAPGSDLTRNVTASPGQEVPWVINLYDTVTLKNDWHGVVLGPDGRPMPGVAVTLGRYGRVAATNLVTDAQGRFSASLDRMSYGEERRQSNNNPPIAVAQKGVLVAAQVVSPDESWHGMTLRLAPGAALTGTLTDPQGRPAAYAGVTLDGWLLGSLFLNSTQDATPIPGTVTDRRGRFTLDGLPPGQYQLRIRGGGFGDMAVPEKVTTPMTVQPYLALAAGQRRDVGRITVPRADRTLIGTVVDVQGRPVPPLWVGVSGAHTYQTTVTQQNGTFRVYNVVDEPLSVLLSGAGKQMTVPVPQGQATVHIVAPSDVFTAPLPDAAAAAASVVRPNDLDRLKWFALSQGPGDAPAVWQGSLADVDGMRLTVRRGRGTLTDRAGRTLWAGGLQDPPDYTVTRDLSRPGVCTVTVRDGRGKTLWSGPADPQANLVEPNGDIRVISPDNTVVWQRTVGTARVAERQVGAGLVPALDMTPGDATLTLHVVPATAALAAADGHALWTGPATVVLTDATGFPLPPPGSPLAVWENVFSRRQVLGPPMPQPLLAYRNVPHGAKVTFQDAQGRLLPLTVGPFQ